MQVTEMMTVNVTFIGRGTERILNSSFLHLYLVSSSKACPFLSSCFLLFLLWLALLIFLFLQGMILGFSWPWSKGNRHRLTLSLRTPMQLWCHLPFQQDTFIMQSSEMAVILRLPTVKHVRLWAKYHVTREWEGYYELRKWRIPAILLRTHH